MNIPLNPIKPPFSYGFPMVFPMVNHPVIQCHAGRLAVAPGPRKKVSSRGRLRKARCKCCQVLGCAALDVWGPGVVVVGKNWGYNISNIVIIYYI